MAEKKGADAPKPKGKLKLMAMAGAPLLLLGGGAGAYFMGVLPFGHEAGAAVEHGGHDSGGRGSGGHRAKAGAGAGEIRFVDLPDIIVNLDTGGQRLRFLKLKVALEVPGEREAEHVLRFSPRIMDSFQLYLRALTPDDLNGATGLYRLKEELLARVNDAVGGAPVRDLLFKEMLIQ